MKKRFTILIAAIAAILMMAQPMKVMGQTYTKLTTIGDIDENAQYVLGTYESSTYYFHYEGTSSWGKIAAPTSQTPYYYTLSKGNNNTTFTATVTIGNNTYYLTVPSSNAWTMSTTQTSIYINSGTICASSSSTGRYLQKNGNSGLRSYTANNSYPNAYFYKVTQTITFNGNGGTYNNANTYTQSVNRNYQTALQTNQFTRDGYTFTGWNTSSTGNGTAYAAEANVTLTSDLTLYAQWESNTEPNISASNVNLLVSATSGSIAYTVNNQVPGGVLTAGITAGNTGSWLSLGEITSATVPLNCSANTGAERTATVTLTYTYNTDQTVTKNVIVTQAAPTFTVTYDKNGGSGTNYTTSAYSYGTEITVLGVDDDNIGFTAPSGKAFDHWSTAPNGGDTYDPDEEFTITDNVTLYAQWRTLHTYSLVTSIDQLVSGKHYILVNGKTAATDENKNAKAMGKQNYNNTTPSNRAAVPVRVFSLNDKLTILETEGVYEFVINGTQLITNNSSQLVEAYTIYDVANEGFLSASSSSNNNIKFTTTPDENAYWTISIGNDYEAAITAQGNYSRNLLRYNSSSTIFSCYGQNQADGYLYVKSDDTNYDFYTYITAASNWSTASNGWYFIASPVNSDIDPVHVENMLTDDDANGHTYDLYKLKRNTLQNYHGHTAEFVIANGAGYLYANKNHTTLKFSGSSVKTYSTDDNTVTPSHSGWNLIGNPYTFPVKVSRAFSELNNGSAVISNEANSIINPGTGIIVYGTENVTFTKYVPEEQSSGPSNINIMLAQQVASRDGSSTTSVNIDNAIVSFNTNSRLPKFTLLEGNAKLYIPQNGEDYAIAFSNRQGDMPLNFKTTETGNYTISFEGNNMDLRGIYLIDMLAGQEVDLSVNPSYTFIGSPVDKAERFKIVFKNIGNSGNDIFAYQNGNDIIVSGEGELQIFDVTGRSVMTTTISGVETINVPTMGVYIFRLIGSEIKTQKIVVR